MTICIVLYFCTGDTELQNHPSALLMYFQLVLSICYPVWNKDVWCVLKKCITLCCNIYDKTQPRRTKRQTNKYFHSINKILVQSPLMLFFAKINYVHKFTFIRWLRCIFTSSKGSLLAKRFSEVFKIHPYGRVFLWWTRVFLQGQGNEPFQ